MGRPGARRTRSLADLESDAEGLIVNRLADPRQYAIAPIDQCYALVGLVKANWEGISGGTGLERAIAGFFDRAARGRRRRERADGAERPPAAATAPVVPAPEFTILGVEAIRYAAAPTLEFTGHVTEPQGREVYTIALTAQIMIDPARRSYDDATRERLVDLFGEPERWATTTHSFLWAELGVLVPAFTGATAFRAADAVQLRPRAGGHQVPLLAARTATCRSPSTSPARSSTAARTAGCRS